ncbi:MAG: HTTM domain-containing protein [Myxococcota bacterium]
MGRARDTLEGWWERLHRPLDAASLAAFRILFGLLMAGAVVRYVQMGWIDRFYVQSDFRFTYWGFEWVKAPPEQGMYVLFAGMFVLALCVAAGLFYRFAIAAFFVVFTYVELVDVTNYLNHYYQVSLLALIMAFLPLHRAWSLDARRRPALRTTTFPAWMTYLLRFQVGVVYFYAALAKAGPDWLLHGQPLGLWLAARTDTPLIGPLLDLPWVALAMSWAGFLHDLLVVPALLWRRSRPFAYAVLVVFHAATGYFFNIGIFPFLMITTALVFFSPTWPRKLLRYLPKTRLPTLPASASEPGAERERGAEGSPRALPREGEPSEKASGAAMSGPARGERAGVGGSDEIKPERERVGASGEIQAPPLRVPHILGTAAVALYCLFQLVMPLRAHAYGGDVLWHEQGMRWSWRVMVREKQGSVTYHVRLPDGRSTQVSPCRYLSQRQEREMAGQPDLILQLAHRIAEDFRARGHGEVEVRAEALVSLNGRPPEPMIDSTVDLTKVSDGVAKAAWILPAPSGAPAKLRKPSGKLGRGRMARWDGTDDAK